MPETYTDEPGRHRHQCQDCGVIWGHADAVGDALISVSDLAHSCPGCGRRHWDRYYGPLPPAFTNHHEGTP